MQPSIAPSTSATYADTWVGIDGYDGKLLQAGTTARAQNGTVSYQAWFVAWTGAASGMTVIRHPVAPGDRLEVAIDRTTSGEWAVSLSDATAGWSWSTTVTYSAAGSTAEWIEEAPGTWSTPSRYQTLADYGTVTFTTVRADGAAPATVTTFDIAQNGATVSYVSTYDPSQGSLALQYGQPGPAVRSASQGSESTVTDRIYGATVDATAAAELEHQFTYAAGHCPGTAGSRPVVLATDATSADALASAYLASYLETGTLLTPSGHLSAVTLTAIREEGITKVYVVGGPLAVSTTVVRQLELTTAAGCGGTSAPAGTGTIQVTRIAGNTANATAERIAETPPASNVGSASFVGAYDGANGLGGTGRYNETAGLASAAPASAAALPTALMATGKAFQDAESGATLTYADRFPTLLTTSTTLSPDALSAIEALGIEQVIVMGGPDAVSDAVVFSLERLGVSVLRVAGQTYSETSVELLLFETATASSGDGLGWPGTGSITVAQGDGFTDGLAGAALAADGPSMKAPQPMVLTLSPTAVGTALGQLLHAAGTGGIGGTPVTHLTILGGPLAITSTAVDAMGSDL